MWHPSRLPPFKKIAELTIPSDAQYVDVTGLDLNSDKLYKILLICKNNSSNALYLRIYINGDYNYSNYRTSYISLQLGNLTYETRSDCYALNVAAGDVYTLSAIMVRNNSTANGNANWLFEAGSFSSRYFVGYTSHYSNVTNVTSIRIDTGVSGGIAANSKILIYGGV
jgi:hypothetical protein